MVTGRPAMGFWSKVEFLHQANKLRLHVKRPLRPKAEIPSSTFTWKMNEERNWVAFIKSGATSGFHPMSTKLYLSEHPGYGWWQVGGISNLALVIIGALLAANIVALMLFFWLKQASKSVKWPGMPETNISKEIHNLVEESEAQERKATEVED